MSENQSKQSRTGELIEEILLYRRELRLMVEDHACGQLGEIEFFTRLQAHATKKLSVDPEKPKKSKNPLAELL